MILPEIIFIDDDDPRQEQLNLGWSVNGSMMVHKDGTYDVNEDVIYIYNQLTPVRKLKTIFHELGHAMAFRVPFHDIREIFNWFLDTKYNHSLLYTPLSDYIEIFGPWRVYYGRFPWLFGFVSYPKMDVVEQKP